MDDDDRLYLAENYSGSNTADENDIDSDLEDKLYAAVFHSNDTLSKDGEIAGYNNFTSLTDVIGCWKSIPDNEKKNSDNKNNNRNENENENENDLDHGNSNSLISRKLLSPDNPSGEKSNSLIPNVESYQPKKKQASINIPDDGISKKNSDVNIADKESSSSIDLYKGEGEMQIGIEAIPQGTDTYALKKKQQENIADNLDNKNSQKRNMKKQQQRYSPKKLFKSKDYATDDNSTQSNLLTHDINQHANLMAQIDFLNNSGLQETIDSSAIRSEKEVERNESAETERTVSLLDNQIRGIEIVDGKPPPSFESEDSKTAELKNLEVLDTKDSGEEVAADIKPEEEKEIEKLIPMENIDGFKSTIDSSSSNSSSQDSSSSSSSSEGDRRDLDTEKNENDGKNFPAGNDIDEIITLDDSDESIYEIPVPPKPRPPTINLDDSESLSSSSSSSSSSSCSSASDAEEDNINTEVMTPEKLVESYKNAVLKTKSVSRRTQIGRKVEATPEKKKKKKKKESKRTYDSVSDSDDDSMTQSEEENWGIIAGSQINRRISDSHDDNLSREIEGQDTVAGISGNGDKDKGENPSLSEERESAKELSSRFPSALGIDAEKNGTNSDLNAEKESQEVERPSTGITNDRQILDQENNENGEKESEKDCLGNDERPADDNTLIINTKNAKESSELGEYRVQSSETPVRISDNRKRALSDNGKKSRNQNSPKKAKGSDELVETPSVSKNSLNTVGNKSRKEGSGRMNKDRNCAADYFFKPMNNEMENYYNKSWGGENFDIDYIRKQMPRDPRHWAVLNEDLLGYQQRRSRYWTESKCRNCNHTGHHIAECPEKRKVASCHMCGTPGHREPRCPNKMCLGCGKKQKTYTQVCKECRRAWCGGCKSYGHGENSCPDLWRRYHVTTSQREMNTNLSSEDVMKPQHLLSCCNCAKRGHDSTTCDNYRWSRHFPTPAYVSDYNSGPGYPRERVSEDLEVHSDRIRRLEKEKKRKDNAAACTVTSSNEGKKRKSNTIERGEENIDLEILSESRIEEKSSNIEESKRKSVPVDHSSSIPKNLSKKTDEILFTLTSKLLDNNFIHLANFGDCSFPLYSEQYKELTDPDSSGEFLANLTSQFPMKIEIKRSRIGEISLTIASTKDLHSPIHITIMDWLNWDVNERSRFVNLSLPTTKDQLVKLLSDKLNELDQDLGNPCSLHDSIQSLKINLAHLKRESQAGGKSSSSSKRARVVEKLANSQCRLNMILFGQMNLNKTIKSLKYLKNALNVLKKAGNGSFVCAATYLLMVHHYNIIFAAYTPKNLPDLIDTCKKSWRSHKIKQKRLSISKTDPGYRDFIESINLAKGNRKSKAPSSSSASTFFAGSIIRNSNNGSNKGSKSPGLNRNEDCSGVENQFVVPEDKANQNVDSNLMPVNQIPSNLGGLDISNRYNMQFNLGSNDTDANFQRRGGNEFENNCQEADYIALDNRNLQNSNDYNNFNNKKSRGGISYNERRGRRRGRSANSRNSGNDNESRLENELFDDSYIQIDNNSPLERIRNRWEENRGNRDNNDMFYSDTRASSGMKTSFANNSNDDNNYFQNDHGGTNVFSRNELIDRRNEYNEGRGEPSTSGIRNNDINNQVPNSNSNLNLYSNENRSIDHHQQLLRNNNKTGVIINNNNNNKDNNSKSINNIKSKKNKKKHRTGGGGGGKLPPYLQKRAAKNIAKYIDSGFPRITQAAKALQKKLSDKELTLQCVIKFEGLVKQKLKKTDYLL